MTKVNVSILIASLSRHLRVALLLMPALFALLPNIAHADRNFTTRFTANVHGDMTLIGNSIITCSSGTGCTSAQSEGMTGASQNNNFQMANIDVDGNSGTFNSSTATISIPSGSTVIFAGLYWMGVQPLPTTSDGNWANRGASDAGATCNSCQQVQFATPASGYTTVTASQYDTVDNTAGTSATIGGTTYYQTGYEGFANVTSLVAAGGSGTYTVANLHTSLYWPNNSWGEFGGWTLVVAYSNPSLVLHNLTVFDGFKFLSSTGSSVSATISGFLTPLSGPVVSRIGVFAGDGDRGNTGDQFSVNGTTLSDAMNPANDFFNSTVSRQGVSVTSRNPSYSNTLGIDIDEVNVPSGAITNGASSATLVASTGGEGYWLGLFTFTTTLYEPNIADNAHKTATDVNGGDLLPGDTLHWKVDLSNTGLDAAVNLLAIDNLPDGLTYVPGTIAITAGANSGSKTDASGDDQGEYFASGSPCDSGKSCVRVRLGTGANATQGGSLSITDGVTAFEFDTVVNGGTNPSSPGYGKTPPASGTAISNSVVIQYNGQTLGTSVAASNATATAAATVLGPPSLVKTFSPNVIDANQVSTMTITVTNPPGNPKPLTGVGFTDTYPSGLINAASPNAQVNCTSGSSAGTLSGGTAGGNNINLSGATLALGGSCVVTVNVTSAAIGNYSNVTSAVTTSNAGNGQSGAAGILSVGRPSISKAFAQTTVTTGTPTTLTFTLSNVTVVTLHNSAFTDALPAGLVVAPTPNVHNNCGGGSGTGTVSAPAGASSIGWSGGVLLPATGTPPSTTPTTCTISVDVTSATAGVYDNTTTGVSSTESGAAGLPSNTATLTVVAPPTLTKSFFPVSVQPATASQMTLTVSNPNTTTTITGVAFSDTYGTGTTAGLANSTPSGATSPPSCTSGSSATLTGGANGGNNVGLSGGTLAPGGSCTITLNVQSATTGNKANTTSTVTTTNAGTGAAAGATLNVTTLTAPTVTKAFGTASIATGATTTLTITLTNSNTGTNVTGVNFTDNFPVGLVIASTPSLSYSCNHGFTATGTVTAIAGGTVLALTGGTIPSRTTGGGATNGTCTISVNVTSSSTAAYTNSTGTIYTDNGGTFGPATATLNVLAPPQISKSFDPDSVATNTDSTMTLTLSNPTSATVNLTGVSVVDHLPTNVVARTGTGGTCTTAPFNGTFQGSTNGTAWHTVANNDTYVRVTGVTLAPNASCTVTVPVRSGTAGTYTNTTNAVAASGPVALTGGTASAVLSVARIDITKSFCTNPIAANTNCTMTLALTNTSGGARAGAQFVDNFPNETATGGDFIVGTPTGIATTSATNCPTGSIQGRTGTSGAWGTLAAGNTSIRVNPSSTITIPTGGCTYTLNVRSTQTLTNTIAAGALTATGGYTNGADTSATLQIYQPPLVSKSFADSSILVNGTTTMTIRLTDLNSVNATTVALTDAFPGETTSGGPISLSSATVSNGCGGTLQGRTGSSSAFGTLAVNNTALSLTGGTISAAGYCEITVTVKGTSAGAYTNTIAAGSVTTSGTGNIGTGPAADVSATLTVIAPPTITKTFSPTSMQVNDASLLSITLTNPNATVAIAGVDMTDTYPSGVKNATPLNIVNNSCGGTVTATAGGASIALAGGTIPANGSCVITVQVTSATASPSGSPYTNTIVANSVTTTNAGTAPAANVSATLTVTPLLPTLNMLKLVQVVSDPVNGTTFPKAIPGAVMQYTIQVTNSGLGTVDNNTIVVSDTALPSQVQLCVSTLCAPSGPFVFTDSAPTSGLSCTFSALNDTSSSRCVWFSNDGSTWNYYPTADANGYDVNVKGVRFKPAGTMNAAGASTTSGQFTFRVKLK